MYLFYPIQMCNPANLNRAGKTIDCWLEPDAPTGGGGGGEGGGVKLYTEEPHGHLAIGLLLGTCLLGYGNASLRTILDCHLLYRSVQGGAPSRSPYVYMVAFYARRDKDEDVIHQTLTVYDVVTAYEHAYVHAHTPLCSSAGPHVLR